MRRFAWALSLALVLVPAFAVAEDEAAAPAEQDQPAPAAAEDQPAAPAEDGPEALFGRLDVNQDGQLSEDELPDDQQRFFRRLRRTADRDGDDQLSREEFVAGLAERPIPGAGQPGQAPRAEINPEELFRRADRNRDEKVTLDEFPEERREALRPRFERADRDGDGALSMTEFGELARAFARDARTQPGRPPQTQPAQTDQGATADGEQLFFAIDANGDGALSADEIAAAAEAIKKLDFDGDGTVTREELRPRPAAAGAPGRGLLRRFAEADRDGDGKLSREEAPEQLQEAFDRIDADGDGLIDRRDVRQFLASTGGGPGVGLGRLIRDFDRDGDGKVSREEAPERIRGVFDRLDANGDGFIDRQEIRDRTQSPPSDAPPPAERSEAPPVDEAT